VWVMQGGDRLTPAVATTPGDRELGFWIVNAVRRFSDHRRSGGRGGPVVGGGLAGRQGNGGATLTVGDRWAE
jgi:hypothetical protein